QEVQGEALTERPGPTGAAEARATQPGLPGAAQGAEAAGGDALSALDASGEADADPRLEASRREAPVREASARTGEVDSQRALRAIEQVRVQLRPGQRTAEIQLAPAELGRLAIRLKVERGNVHAVVRVEQPETLAALERFLPELRAALSAQGLDVGGMDLGLAGDGAASFSESLDESAPRPTPALERHVNLPTLGVSDDAVDTFA
ncbi:MAG: flagellar hook-length control protein FliK, partial [Planctomycetota bacterium]